MPPIIALLSAIPGLVNLFEMIKKRLNKRRSKLKIVPKEEETKQ